MTDAHAGSIERTSPAGAEGEPSVGALLAARFLTGDRAEADREAAIAVLTDVIAAESTPPDERAVTQFSLGQLLMATLLPADLLDPDQQTADVALSDAAMTLASVPESPGRRERAVAALSHLRAAADVGVTTELAGRLRHAAGLGGLLLHELIGEGDSLDRAIADLEDACATQPSGAGLPSTSRLLRSLRRAYRRRAQQHSTAAPEDLQAATDAGLAALVEEIGTVLLQDGADDRLRSALRVAGFAHRLALDSIAEENPEASMAALELGRGVVLYAATTKADLLEVLDAAGLRGLAAEWRAIGPDRSEALPVPALPVPVEAAALLQAFGPDATETVTHLRLRTLDALADTALGQALFSPCDADGVAATLQATGRDALVYLLSGDADRPGWALIVTDGGALRSVELPGLRIGPGGPLDAFLAAAGPGGQPADPAVFDELRHWAALCVLGPVLARLPGGEPRATLVPTGPLAAVPWHAAILPRASGSGQICKTATWSYAATARQFVDLARRPRSMLSTRPVFLQDPGLDLWYAGGEVEAIRTRWYPSATWYGGYDEDRAGAGTPEEVLRHLPGGPDPASLLHVASHATTVDPPLASSLQLARADERSRALDVARMLVQAYQRPPTAPGGLVVLSACRSDVTVSAYDLSLTIGTAFIAAGAAGVVASLWTVPDQRTSVLMYVLHERLQGGEPPDVALRTAQRWMLDPGRRVPEGLPAALVEVVQSADLADPIVWAAFTCQG